MSIIKESDFVIIGRGPDSYKYSVKDFESEVTSDYLPLSGGTLTGDLRSNSDIITDETFSTYSGGTGHYGFLLKDEATEYVRLGISHPSASKGSINYRALTGSRHCFYNHDEDGGNGTETIRFDKNRIDAYGSVYVHGPNQIIFNSSAQNQLWNILQQGDSECRLNVAEGRVFKIVGSYNNVTTQLFQVNPDGQVVMNQLKTPTLPHQPANMAYVDSKVGQILVEAEVPELEIGQMCFNTTNKTLLIKVAE